MTVMFSNRTMSARSDGTPAVSVIIPCHNAAEHIERALHSVYAQTFTDFEVVVVDNGSTDATRDIVASHEDDRTRLHSEPVLGVSRARNRGVATSRGECIAFLDADDTWHPAALSLLHTALSKHTNAAVAYCGWQNIGLSGPRGRPFIPPDYEESVKMEHWLRTCGWPIHAALTRKTCILEVGGFDVELPTSEDYLLWLMIVVRHQCVRVPQVLAFYHHHGSERATSNIARLAIQNWEAKRIFLREFPHVRQELGAARTRELVDNELLRKGYECFWARQLEAAHRIFRKALRTRSWTSSDLPYLLPALLPAAWFRSLVHRIDRKRKDAGAAGNTRDAERKGRSC